MKSSDVKKKIELALESVKGLSEPYKLETYKIILSNSLKFSISTEKEIVEQNNTKPSNESKDMKQNIKKLTDLCKISARELFDVLKIDNGEVILKKILTGTEAEQQILGSQLILLGYEFGLGVPEVDSSTLKGALKKSNITDKSRNFAQYMKHRKDLFSFSSKSTKRKLYSLTANKGRTSAVKLLTKLAGGKENES